MDYLKSAFQHLAKVSGVGTTLSPEDVESPNLKMYDGKTSAKIVLEYIEQNMDTTSQSETCSKEQFMKIEIEGSEGADDLASFVQQSGYTHVILAVDQSGSMSGSPMNQVKQALVYMLEETFKQENILVDIFTYYQKISSIQYTDRNYKTKIDGISAGGRTYFNIVFDKIREVAKSKVRDREIRKTVVVFMTDGADTSGEVGKLQTAQKACMEHLKMAAQATVVHVVGFSKDHDYKFMNEINHLGKQEGLFRYCEPGDGPEALRDKLAELFDLITAGGDEYFDVEVNVPSGLKIVTTDGFATQKVLPLRLHTSSAESTDEDGSIHKVEKTVLQANTWIYVETEDAAPNINIKVLQTVKGEKVPVECDVVEISAQAITKPVDKVEWSLNILERNIDLLTAKVGMAILKKKDLSTLENRLEKLQKKVSETKIYDFRVRKEDRKLLLEHVSELQAKLDALHKMIAEVKRGECHQVSMLARANDLRYQVQFSKTRRHRLMDQRIRVNVEKMKREQAELDKLSVNKEEVEGLSTESAEFYLCTLSQMNIKEILFDPDDKEDCLGFGLAVKRPEHVLDDPTALCVWAVSGTLVSRSAMMDALNYKIDVEGPLMAHGGFNMNKELGVATVGMSREPINAWLPMYICPSHWQRVKVLLKPTLGYLCTLDPLGYSFKQTDVLFQVLGSMIGQLEPANCNQHQVKMIFAFHRLCVAVVEDFQLSKPLEEAVENFLTSPMGRTKDVVPNLFVVFGYILCLSREQLHHLFGGDMKERNVALRQLWLSVLTECVRRAASKKYKETSDAHTDGILHKLSSAGVSTDGKSDLTDGDLLELWKTCQQGKIAQIDIPEYHVDTGVSVPEVKEPVKNSDKVDKAMEVWAQAKCGVLRNKNQEENVKKASAIVKNWVDEGHQNVDAAVKSERHDVVEQTRLAETAGAMLAEKHAEGESLGEGVSGETEDSGTLGAEWSKESLKDLVSILQVAQKLTGAMYPRIGNITGFMAYLSFWLKEAPDFAEMDKNSGLPSERWTESVKEAVTKLHCSITENAGEKKNSVNQGRETSQIQALVAQIIENQPCTVTAGEVEPAEGDYDDEYEDYDDDEEETAEDLLQKQHRAARQREPRLCEVLSVVCTGQSTSLLRAILIQAVSYHRNAAARAAAADGAMLDLKQSENSRPTLENVKKMFEEKEKAAILGAIEKVFWQRSNYAMLQAPTVWSFIGYLMNTYKERGEGLSEFLKIVISTDRPVQVPETANKVKIIMMGKHKDHTVLSNGNIWMPEKKVCKKFAEALGEEVWASIEVDLLSNVAIHVYRESDIPNRHGYCNSNPYIPNVLRRKLGMDPLPERKKGAPRRSKLLNKWTK